MNEQATRAGDDVTAEDSWPEIVVAFEIKTRLDPRHPLGPIHYLDFLAKNVEEMLAIPFKNHGTVRRLEPAEVLGEDVWR